MPQDPTPQEGQGQPQEGTGSTESTPPQEGGGTPQEGTGNESGQTRSPEELLAELHKKNSEAQNLRQRLKALEDAETERTKAQMTELERAQAERDEARKELEELRQQVRSQATRSQITEVAEKLNFRNPAIAYKLLDQDAIELADDGKVINAEKLLRAELKDNPYLAANGGGEGGTGRSSSAASGGERDISAAIRKAARR